LELASELRESVHRNAQSCKFRSTFATWALWARVDIRTVQAWLGHTDTESTMRYLQPNRSEQVRNKVNEIFA